MFRSILVALLLVTACHHDREAGGPLERAGRGVDHAAQKTGQALGRAGDATTKAFKGAATDLGVRGSPDRKPASKGDPEPSKSAPDKHATEE
ncbi:MAG: hypothetical protein ABUL62_27495 [Myxococcales bacterium]